MAAQVVKHLPEGAQWLYEVKFDGYRALLLKDGKRVEIRSRNDKNMTRLYPAVAAAAFQLKRDQVTLDGEIVAIDAGDWQKLKLERQQELVVGGYWPDGSLGIDALLVGYYEGRKLLFAGKVRNGLIPHSRREVLAKLKPLHFKECPFANLPSEGDSRWGGGVTGSR